MTENQSPFQNSNTMLFTVFWFICLLRKISTGLEKYQIDFHASVLLYQELKNLLVAQVFLICEMRPPLENLVEISKPFKFLSKINFMREIFVYRTSRTFFSFRLQINSFSLPVFTHEYEYTYTNFEVFVLHTGYLFRSGMFIKKTFRQFPLRVLTRTHGKSGIHCQFCRGICSKRQLIISTPIIIFCRFLPILYLF